MVRITGSVKAENSLSAPSGELLSSVVRRSSGNSAKRMSGTESRAPTQTEPTPSKAPRKERLVSRGDPDAERFRIVFSESPAQAHIGFSLNVSFASPLETASDSRARQAHGRTPTSSVLPGCKQPI